ncbi:hypothetical protein [Daejeonia sp. YH14]|uniref:hypothetical protein n=1 Tax=Daejeonia sp. YH14 TaxID=3439042 RepID=UPI003F49151E
MKKILFSLFSFFGIVSYAQFPSSIEKYNESLQRYEYFDSNHQLIGYKKYNYNLKQWEYHDLKETNNNTSKKYIRNRSVPDFDYPSITSADIEYAKAVAAAQLKREYENQLYLQMQQQDINQKNELRENLLQKNRKLNDAGYDAIEKKDYQKASEYFLSAYNILIENNINILNLRQANLYNYAMSLYKIKDYEQAEKVFGSIYRDNYISELPIENKISFYHIYSSLLFLTKKYDSAKNIVDAGLKKYPNSKDLLDIKNVIDEQNKRISDQHKAILDHYQTISQDMKYRNLMKDKIKENISVITTKILADPYFNKAYTPFFDEIMPDVKKSLTSNNYEDVRWAYLTTQQVLINYNKDKGYYY